MEWSKDLSVGEESMDQQHQLLFSYVNDFLDACKAKRDKLFLVQLLEKIQDYTDFHFKEEEEHMASYDYPGLDLHKTIHQSLLKSLEGFIGKVANGDKVNHELKNFLKQWLVSHIQCTDRDYANYIRSKSV